MIEARDRVTAAVARLERAADGRMVGTCVCVARAGAFLGAKHYLASNAIARPEELRVRTASGALLPVAGWDLGLPADLACFRTGAVDVAPLPVAPDGWPADGTTLWIAGHRLDRPDERVWSEGPVSGRDVVDLGPALRFDAFYVECEAHDGMSGSPAVDPATGCVVGLLCGLNPDWGLAAFAPVAGLAP